MLRVISLLKKVTYIGTGNSKPSVFIFIFFYAQVKKEDLQLVVATACLIAFTKLRYKPRANLGCFDLVLQI
jgi:hypothetical protein